MRSFRFRWVFCQLETLRYCLPPSVKRILAELPETLDETYERMLSEIPKSNQVYAHRLLQCLTVAVRPLRVEELAEVLAVDFGATGGIPKLKEDLRWEDQEQAVLSACSSLIAVIEGEDFRVVQFSHFSVKEFLTSDRLATLKANGSHYHHILLEPAHAIMAQACLGVLLRLDQDIDKEKIRSFPLARYAADHFGDHAEFGNVLSYIRDGVDHLLDVDKTHFATWLWVRQGQEERPQELKAIPLYYVAEFGYLGLVNHLISKHPENVNAKSEYGTPLHAASRQGHVEILHLLLEHCAEVDARDVRDQTPLHLAIDLKYLEVIRMLIESNADKNARDIKGRTPLHRLLDEVAVDGGFDVAKFLLGHGADPCTKDNDLSTPLHAASYTGNLKTVQLLLKHGADIHIHARNKKGQTPLHKILDELRDPHSDIYEDTIRLLLEHGVDIDVLDDDRSTPLHVAAHHGSATAARVLLKHGANIQLKNKRGRTPFEVALSAGNRGLMQLLSEDLQSEQEI